MIIAIVQDIGFYIKYKYLMSASIKNKKAEKLDSFKFWIFNLILKLNGMYNK